MDKSSLIGTLIAAERQTDANALCCHFALLVVTDDAMPQTTIMGLAFGDIAKQIMALPLNTIVSVKGTVTMTAWSKDVKDIIKHGLTITVSECERLVTSTCFTVLTAPLLTLPKPVQVSKRGVTLLANRPLKTN